MISSNCNVAIVGAGLAGCSLALALRRIGTTVVLLEKRSCFKATDGSGIVLAGNATRALEALGCGSELRGIAHPVERIAFTDQSEEPLFDIDCSRTGWPPFYATRHARLRGMLQEKSNVEALFNTTILEIENTKRPTLRLSGGRELSCDLLVGADGVHSMVRQHVFEASSPTSVGQYRGFRFITRCPPSIKHPRHFIGNGAVLLLYPLPDGELYCGAGPISPAHFPEAKTPHEAIKEVFADFEGSARQVLDALDESIHYIPTRYWHLELDSWVRNRCVLVGDAAHASAPTLAQGGAMAFEDAQVLAECIDGGGDIDEALAQYQLRRSDRVNAVQRASLRRMDANRRVPPREHRIRTVANRNFGRSSLENFWGRLIRDSP